MPKEKNKRILLQRESAAPVLWGGFKISADDVDDFRQALQKDFGNEKKWSDDEIQQMAYDTIQYLNLLHSIAIEERLIDKEL